MISQFFILSPRGDTIVLRDYIGNVSKGSAEVFFRKVKFWDGGGDAPPVFTVDGVSYLHVKDGGLHLVATARENVSPSLVLELLKRVGGIIRDYCGILSEEAVRRNFVLVYELLDEAVDYGFPQSTSSDALKEFVLNDPVIIRPSTLMKKGMFQVGRGPTGVIKSVLDTSRTSGGGVRRDEIFVDIVEKLTCTFNASGYVQSSQIDGAIQVKSYLAGNPSIRIALNEDLLIGRAPGSGAAGAGGHYGYAAGPGAVTLDGANFHESCQLERFDSEHILELAPPDGEFALMNYRSTGEFRPPYRVQCSLDEDPDSPYKALLHVQLRCDYPSDIAASAFELVVPMPPGVQRVSADPDPAKRLADVQSWDWDDKRRSLVWRFHKLPGGSDPLLRARLTLAGGYAPSLRKDIGPISCDFAIPMYCASRLQVRYLQILKDERGYSPYRWVRYVTMSNSYIFRS